MAIAASYRLFVGKNGLEFPLRRAYRDLGIACDDAQLFASLGWEWAEVRCGCGVKTHTYTPQEVAHSGR